MSGIASLEMRVVLDKYGKLLWLMRRQPWHAAYWMAGIALPPHERFWVGVYFGETKENNVLASRGTSKCQKIGSLIVMADGSLRKIEDVQVGERVMGPDNLPRTVLHTTRGTGKLYTVRQSSGLDYTVNDSHVLSLVHRDTGEIHDIPVEEYLYARRHVQDRYRGFRAGLLTFPTAPVAVDPYFLGLWLGDGCGRNPKITTMDDEVISFLTEYAGVIGATAVVSPTGSRAKNVRLRFNGGRKGNPLWQPMVALGITNPKSGRGTNNKRIPECYQVNDEATRLQLLAGIIDSDGTISKKNFVVSQTNEVLAKDIKRLADWLGFRTKLRQVPISMVRTDGSVYRSTAWRISIGGDLCRIPTRIPRKQFQQGDLTPNKDILRSMVDVVPAGEGEWAGITLDGDHRYLLEDGTVTHNSFTHASLAAPLKGVLYKNVAILTLSASGFRGGKELFKDAERLFEGQLKSQEMQGTFLKTSIKGQRVITKDPSIWTMPFRSFSRYSTAPTNNPDQLRGLRANEVELDERAFIEDEIPHKIIRPMLMVGSDFRRTAAGGDTNKMYQISTIDFTVRGWWNELMVAERQQRNEYAAAQARKQGDWEEYDRLMNENEGQLKSASFSFTKVDYSDLLIPEFVNTLDGEHRYRVEYPREEGIEVRDVLRWDEMDGIAYWYTYPVDKKGLEEPLRNGTVDPEIWLAEQRNIPISSSGNVFDHELLQRVAERPIPVGNKVKRRKAADEDEEARDEFYAPVMYSCGDPCVLGVDVARESDETTFVVIRLGELAEGEFSPFVEKLDSKGRPLLGNTPWNHICWATSHRKLEADDAARKVRELHQRFNIIKTVEIGGIAMDQKGGGSAVRDNLGNPKPAVIDGVPDASFDWSKLVKIYDPEDENGYGHYSGQTDAEQYWSGLRLVNAQNQENVDWTYAARALMQAKKLYIAFWMPPSRWAWDKGLLTGNGEPDREHPEYRKWEEGYNGIRRLKSQLLRLQTKVTETGVIRFVMPGDRKKEEGKKDLWAAMIYAVSLARLHLVALTKGANDAPMVEPLVVYPTRNLGGFFPTFDNQGW